MKTKQVNRHEWKTKVYHMAVPTRLPKEWTQIRREVFARDDWRCQRCDKRYRAVVDLTAHHIKPYEEGGSDDPSNLITLCHERHDWVELRSDFLTTADLIRNSLDDDGEPTSPNCRVENHDETESWRPAWHRWVYGGGKNPRL